MKKTRGTPTQASKPPVVVIKNAWSADEIDLHDRLSLAKTPLRDISAALLQHCGTRRSPQAINNFRVRRAERLKPPKPSLPPVHETPPPAPEIPHSDTLGVAFKRIDFYLGRARARVDPRFGWTLDGIPARFDDVMREVNRQRVRLLLPQYGENRRWLV